MNKKLLRYVVTTLGSFALIVTVVSAWTAPSAQPPLNNVSEPINVGTYDQTKHGNFYIGSGKNIAAGGYVMAPQLCIGGDCRSVWPTGGSSYTAGNGITISGNTISLNTQNISTCTGANQKIIWGGTSFTCATDLTGGSITGGTCAAGQVVTSISSTGVPTCASNGVTTISGGSCAVGQVVQSISATGAVTCGTSISTISNGSCAAGQVVKSISSTGAVTCITDATGGGGITGGTCAAGQVVTSISSTGVPACASNGVTTISGGSCAVGQVVKSISSTGAVTCGTDATGGSITGGTCAAGQVVTSINSTGVPTCASIPGLVKYCTAYDKCGTAGNNFGICIDNDFNMNAGSLAYFSSVWISEGITHPCTRGVVILQ